ncbi:unnamed protein product [Nesidiocoris tenuis]|uniref:Uncharacterized protein n=1 Tax=Nesidiocoris tenuis TaxID=355587 RepID=A0A6H5GC05_9HEMI|nr:unnamed protein product [Nesidiocoris tenuis]
MQIHYAGILCPGSRFTSRILLKADKMRILQYIPFWNKLRRSERSPLRECSHTDSDVSRLRQMTYFMNTDVFTRSFELHRSKLPTARGLGAFRPKIESRKIYADNAAEKFYLAKETSVLEIRQTNGNPSMRRAFLFQVPE